MIDDMEVGDFIIVNGEVVKITRYEVEFQGRKILVDGKEPNIEINNKVLQASGFIKIDNSAIYKCVLKKDNAGNEICSVIYNIDRYICEISMSIDTHSDFSKEVRVLSELQDFLRDKTGKELPIKIDELAAIFK